MSPFHLAIPVNNLEESKQFFMSLFKATIGRECEQWVDLNFFGHQLSIHLKPEETAEASKNTVDGKQVPVRHFGVVLDWEIWHELADRLKAHNIDFIIKPYIRFKGKIGEQATMFFLDPSGNALEFKSFKDKSQLFNA
ncbi:MAG: VOC family protein [Rickettsiales bacterium]|nr:VOC family protein [Rickettsiales bacterium]